MCVTSCFCLTVFKSLSLSLVFDNLIIMCLGVGLFRVAEFGTHYASWIWMSVSFSKVRAAISHWAVLCCAKLLQSCPTLCDPVDHSPPGSSVHGIFQARIQAQVAMPLSWEGPLGSFWSIISSSTLYASLSYSSPRTPIIQTG